MNRLKVIYFIYKTKSQNLFSGGNEHYFTFSIVFHNIYDRKVKAKER